MKEKLQALYEEAQQMYKQSSNADFRNELAQGLTMAGITVNDTETTAEDIVDALAYLHSKIEAAIRIETPIADTLPSSGIILKK